jgi:hypothetical protein
MREPVAYSSPASIAVVHEYALISLAGIIRTHVTVETIGCPGTACATSAAIPIVTVIREALGFEAAWFTVIP